MGQTITLTAADGHSLSAYRADPEGTPRAGLVVVQEIFGVNAHIRAVCDRLAAQGYRCIAPALFDRLRRGVELGYGEDDVALGRELRGGPGWEKAVVDIDAARAALAEDLDKVGAVGFCWGGSLAWLSACRLTIDAAVCYYGAQIPQFLQEHPHCPVMMHFGEDDPLIPGEEVAKICLNQPDVQVHVYDHTGHGFNCDLRPDYSPDASKLAMERTLAFFGRHLG